jgi:hypothetical protein
VDDSKEVHYYLFYQRSKPSAITLLVRPLSIVVLVVPCSIEVRSVNRKKMIISKHLTSKKAEFLSSSDPCAVCRVQCAVCKQEIYFHASRSTPISICGVNQPLFTTRA